MSQINDLTPLSINDLTGRSQKTNQKESVQENEGRDFGDTIGDFLKAVNDNQKESEKAAADVIQGNSDNLPNAMAKLEESRSYQELKRMQI